MEISKIPLDSLVNKVIKILSGGKSSLINMGLKTNLQPGKHFQGEIIKILPEKKMAISIAGKKIIAELPETRLTQENNPFTKEAKYSFKPGNKIYVKVEKINPWPVLKLIPPASQHAQEEGYTTNFSGKIKPKFIKFEKSAELRILPDGNIPVQTSRKDYKNSLPVGKKAEVSFKFDNNAYSKIEKINPSPTLNLIPIPEQNIKDDRFIEKISSRTKPEILSFSSFKNSKFPTDNIIPVKIIRTNNINRLLVQFEGQNFFVKSDDANLYAPGEKVSIQLQKVSDGFLPVLLNIRRNLVQNNKDGEGSNLNYAPKPKNLGSIIQAQSSRIDNGNNYAQKNSQANSKIIDLRLIKPYLPIRKPFGKLIGELKREVLESPILKKINIQPELKDRLRETLQILTPKPNTLPKESYIKRQVEISGIHYEAKVKQLLSQPENPKTKIDVSKDLKGQLLELSQISEKVIRKTSDKNLIRQLTDFQQKVKISVDNIELNQISTKISNQENQPLVLQIPDPISPNEKTINLFIRKDSRENKSGENSDKKFYNLAFYLELSSLGNIKMDVKVSEDSMLVRMDVGQEDIAEFVRNNAPEFEQRMKKNDLNTTVECCKEEKVLPIKDNLIELLVSKNTPLLNLRT